ncbi:MAG: glycosyltransferase family 2 protein [Pseudohongiellaceae bacterium]|nr:glycosyltransferase family 2 protein [Pseudohongiellaceae bacterium]
MSDGVRIAILLPTYNGAQYLAQQLDSLLSQTYSNFIIVIRDDGSSDDTARIIERYARDNANKFHIVESDGDNLGAKSGFSLLIQYVLDNKRELGLEQAYMMFCDQDDVWKQNKISESFECMRNQEDWHPDTPILVHTDLEVVDDKLQTIAPSFFSFQNLRPERNSLWRLLIVNTVTGCTGLINEALARKAVPIPNSAVMHDWWVALVAALFGRIVTVPQATLYYRQHGGNTVGANKYEQRNATERLKGLLKDTSCEEVALQVYRQSRALSDVHGASLTVGNKFRLLMLGLLNSSSRRLRTAALKIFSLL